MLPLQWQHVFYSVNRQSHVTVAHTAPNVRPGATVARCQPTLLSMQCPGGAAGDSCLYRDYCVGSEGRAVRPSGRQWRRGPSSAVAAAPSRQLPRYMVGDCRPGPEWMCPGVGPRRRHSRPDSGERSARSPPPAREPIPTPNTVCPTKGVCCEL